MSILALKKWDFGLVHQAYCEEFDLKNLGKATVQTLVHGQSYTVEPERGSVYMMVMDGALRVEDAMGRPVATLTAGCHAELTMHATVHAEGNAFLVQTHYYAGLTRMGFMLEERCSLRFIDGCRDTLLISPLIKGDPCLNFLHIPKYTVQTLHTHPSARFGLVLSGKGVCVVEDDQIDLVPMRFFVVQDNVIHQFLTEDSELNIFVFHPDSDFGPSNAEHPMINRSFIDGTSVTELRKRCSEI